MAQLSGEVSSPHSHSHSSPYSILSGVPNELIVFDEHHGTPEGIRLVNMAMTPRSVE